MQKLKNGNPTATLPLTDVFETPGSFVLKIDMPGVTQESMNVTVDDKTLVVTAFGEPRHVSQGRALLKELRTRTYRRSFALGKGIDRNAINAEFELGVLTLTIPKVARSRTTEIHINQPIDQEGGVSS